MIMGAIIMSSETTITPASLLGMPKEIRGHMVVY